MSCPDCFKGGVHTNGTPTGKIETLHGIRTYIASPPEEEQSSSSSSSSSSPSSASTIIFITDAFGFNLINNKLLADQYALGTNLRVLVPDIIPGGGAPISILGPLDSLQEPVAWYNVFGQLRRVAAIIFTLSRILPFILRAAPPKAYPKVLAYTRQVKAGLPAGAKLGVAGFCWGGYMSVYMSKETATATAATTTTTTTTEEVDGGNEVERLVDAQFCAHPSAISENQVFVDAVKTFNVPFSVAIGDKDMVMSKTKVEELQAALRDKVGLPEENHYEVRLYEGGILHGFAVRAHEDKEVEVEAARQAGLQAIDWFKKYL